MNYRSNDMVPGGTFDTMLLMLVAPEDGTLCRICGIREATSFVSLTSTGTEDTTVIAGLCRVCRVATTIEWEALQMEMSEPCILGGCQRHAVTQRVLLVLNEFEEFVVAEFCPDHRIAIQICDEFNVPHIDLATITWGAAVAGTLALATNGDLELVKAVTEMVEAEQECYPVSKDVLLRLLQLERALFTRRNQDVLAQATPFVRRDPPVSHKKWGEILGLEPIQLLLPETYADRLDAIAAECGVPAVPVAWTM